MNKTERIKKRYLELAEVVNAFDLEAVQLIIVERLAPLIDASSVESEPIVSEPQAVETEKSIPPKQPKKFGATKALHRLLQTDYFDTPKTITTIVEHCNRVFNMTTYTSDFSGVLLKFVSLGKLKRIDERNEKKNSSQFFYLR